MSRGKKADPEMVRKAVKMAADGFRIPSIVAVTGLSAAWIYAHTKATKGKGNRRAQGSFYSTANSHKEDYE